MSESLDLTALISSRLAAGERLLAAGAMVGSTDEHRYWRSSRDLWIAGTIRELSAVADESAAGTFRRSTAPVPGEGTIAEDLPVEMEAVRHGMAVLIGVRSRVGQTGAA